MVRIESVNADNIWEIVKLKVGAEQQSFVAPNDVSIMEAYLSLAGGHHAYPFGIYADDVPVGFLMIGYDVDDGYRNPPPIAYENYDIWRFMIDERYQNRGYGKQALSLALDFVRTFPCGKAEYCYLDYMPDNLVAKKFYGDFGFVENGQMDGEAVVAALKL